MGVCYLYGNGGESNAALVNVVGGTTQPTNPTYGTIWCQTSTAINGWEIFSVSPTWEAAEGHIYLQSVPTTSRDIPNFSALDATKKPYGFVWVQISGVKQRINGAWTFLNAYMWRDNTWTQISKASPATLNVTYPASSVCTAKSGTVTYTAPNTSGTWSQALHNNGTWTVTCSDGSQTKSANVSITADGETKSVALSYFAATINVTYPAGSSCKVIFGDTTQWAPDTSGYWACTVFATGTYVIQSFSGNLIASQNVSITYSGQNVSATLSYVYYVFGGSGNYTGGWTALGNVTSVGSEIKCYVDWSWAGCQAFTNAAFDVSNYTKLNVNVSAVSAIRDQASFGLSRSKPNTVMWNGSFTNKNNCAAIKSITSAGVYTLDISSLSGNYYFWTGQNGTGWGGSSGFTIDKIWLS